MKTYINMVGEQIVALAFLSLICVSGAVSVSDDSEDTLSCIPYRCKTDEQEDFDKRCVFYDTEAEINYVDPCDSGYECLGNPKSDYTCSVKTTEKAYPGEICSQASDCDSNTCTAGLCAGKAIDQPCTDDKGCAPGLYCATESTNTCSLLKPSGSACFKDEECTYGTFCKISSGSGRCTAYFTTDSGTAVDKCRGELVDWQCSTAFCIEVTNEDTKSYQCSEVYTLEKPSTPCSKDDECVGKNSDETKSMNTKCKCGYSEDAHAYCELLPGNTEYSNYIRYTKLWFESKLESNCNTARRGNLACVEAHWDPESFYTLQYYALKTQLWPQIHDVESCVQKTFLGDYLQAKDDYLDNLETTCVPFKAKKDGQTFEEDTCVLYDDDDQVYYVQPCADGKVCTKDKSQYTCEDLPTSKLYPGEACKENIDCESGVCTNSKCVGKAIDEACTKDLECNPGSYCDKATTNKCVALLETGSKCDRDWQCDYSNYCQIESDATEGVCAPYFNMPAGSEINSCDEDSLFDFQCSSGACKTELNDSTGEKSYYCLDTLTVKNSKTPCDSNSDCVTTLDGEETEENSECVCGYSQSGKSYCELMPGNTEFATLIKYAKSWLESGLASNCNTARRAELDCISSYWDAENLYSLMYFGYRTEYWTQIWDVQTEVRDTFATDYWEAKVNYELNTPVKCYSYKCKTIKLDDTCAYFDTESSQFYVQECDDDQVCVAGSSPTENFTCSDIEKPTTPTLYAGEECDSDSDCYSNDCSKDVCVGLAEDSKCTKDEECSYGLYCDILDTKTCVVLLPVDTSCLRDAQCAYGSFCYKAPGDQAGTCKKYLSLDSGTQVDFCGNDYVSFKCKTGYCVTEYDEALNYNSYTCSEVYSLTENTKTCSKDLDCISKNADNSKTIYSECVCGYAKGGKGYCMLKPGNDAYAKYIEYYTKWLKSGKESKCNTTVRQSLGCIEAHWDKENYYNLVYYKYKTEKWYMIQDVDSCVKNIFGTEYWEAKKNLEDYEDEDDDDEEDDDDDDDDDSAFSLVFSAIAALLLLA